MVKFPITLALTKKERPKLKVCRLLGMGLSNENIADNMNLTVEIVGVLINTINHQIFGRKGSEMSEKDARAAYYALQNMKYTD